jgi:hypothetical protein
MYGPFNMHNSHHKTKGQKFKTFFLSQGIDIVAKWTELLSYIYIFLLATFLLLYTVNS